MLPKNRERGWHRSQPREGIAVTEPVWAYLHIPLHWVELQMHFWPTSFCEAKKVNILASFFKSRILILLRHFALKSTDTFYFYLQRNYFQV